MMDSKTRSLVACLVAIPFMLVFGLPAAVYAVHGIGVLPPAATDFLEVWWGLLSRGDLINLLRLLSSVFEGSSDLFGAQGKGVLAVLSVITGVMVLTYALMAPVRNRRRLDGQLGDARFATPAELAAAGRGIELGLSPDRRKPVRVALEGNAISFAPPRSGKSSGLILPNLIGSDAKAWRGPAVVIDPKGELFSIVAERRRAMGRRVLCLDPYGLAGGTDQWNPFAGLQISAATSVSRMIGAMLVETGENNQYFRQRATTALRGAVSVLLEEGETTPAAVRDLIQDHAELQARSAVSANPLIRALKGILDKEPKTFEPILSTAETAFDWLQDEEMVASSSTSTFTMEEVARGHADLFIILPTDHATILAPWLRLVLGELFAAARRLRQPGDERVVVFVDEAAVLQRFGQLYSALGELPGHGLSLWTFWQTRGQIVEHYGKAGLETFLGTAEITTLADLNASLVEEAGDWSKAIGSQTEAVETVSKTANPTGGGTSQSPQRVPLMQPEAISTMRGDELLALIRVSGGQRRPAVLKKTRPHMEKRFSGLYKRAKASPISR